MEIVRAARTENGIVKFCVPANYAGQTLYVDIPYLVRSGSVTIPKNEESAQNTGWSWWQPQQVTIKTVESIFRLDPPQLPLYLP
jgi:hypothetical protein